MNPPVANAGDIQQVQLADRKLKDGRWHELDDLRQILALPLGRRVIWTHLEKCGVFKSVWAPDALIYLNEGRRQVGLELMSDIAAADDNAFVLMMSEARTRESHDNDRRRHEIEEQRIMEDSNAERTDY